MATESIEGEWSAINFEESSDSTRGNSLLPPIVGGEVWSCRSGRVEFSGWVASWGGGVDVLYSLDVRRFGSDCPLLEAGIQRESKGNALVCTAPNAGCLVWTCSDLRFLDEKDVVGTGSIGPDSVEHHKDFTF